MTVTSVLLPTHDDDLIDTVLRAAAASGVEVELVSDAGAAVARWGAAQAVLIGSDLAEAVAHLRPGRRGNVVVLVRGIAAEPDFRVAMDLGASHVAELPMAEEWLVEHLAELADLGAGAGVVWGFVGGSGGVGSSTLACYVAAVAARRRAVALLELDEQGPGLDRLLGGEGERGIRWHDLHAAPGRLSARSLRDALPRSEAVGEALGVLTFGQHDPHLEASVVREVLSAARRGHDLVVVDLPRWPGESASAARLACDRIVLTAAGTVGGVAAARRVLAGLDSDELVELVVRSSRRGVDPQDVAEALGLADPIVFGEDRGLEEQIDLGLGPVSRRRSAAHRAAAAVIDRMDAAS